MDEKQKSKELLKQMAREMRRQELACDPNRLHTMTMAEIYDTVYEVRPAVIEDLLFPGLTILVGDPKIGKSFLMLQLAYHVATGTALWEKHVRQGEVLYLALEDQYDRLQGRMFRMFDEKETEHLHIAIRSQQQGDGLEDQLREFIEKHHDTRLIIIDTLEKIRTETKDNGSYSQDSKFMYKLKEFADRHGICLLLVHHTRKQTSEDPFDKINGTNGLLGSVDSAMIFTKEQRTSNKATLQITGRDQPDTKIDLEIDRDTLGWRLISINNELWYEAPDPLLTILAERLKESGGSWSGTATELNTFLGTDLKPNSLSLKLNVKASVLYHNFGIIFKRDRTGESRHIELRLLPEKEVTVNDGNDDASSCA